MDMSKYLGILRWSLNYTDGTSASPAEPMDPERRKWLQEALEQNVVDPADQMKALLKVLEIKKRDEPESESALATDFVQKKVIALQALQEWVEQMDWAMDLHKLGGLKIVVDLISVKQDEAIRTAAMEVLATSVQNNPKVQEWAMEMDSLNILMDNMRRSGLSKTEQAKTLLAISSLIRDCTKATVAFIKDLKGVPLLLEIIQSGPESETKKYGIQAQRKALFLMRYILRVVPAIKITVGDLLLTSFSVSMQSQDLDVRENSLHLLLSMFEDDKVVGSISDESRGRIAGEISKMNNKELDEVTVELVASLSKKLQSFPKPQQRQDDQEGVKLLKM